jgi:alpha-glucosidase
LGSKITVKDEEATFRFTANHPAFFHPVEKFENSYEQNYLQQPIAAFDSARLTTLPMVVAIPDGPKVGIMEADLFDYAGLYLTLDEQNKFSLKGTLPKKVTAAKIGGHNNFNLVVQSRADYIAETAGTRSFPWRVLTLAESDKDLLHQQLVYLLASESRVADVSWIKPGKVSWDWWSALNLTGVDFKTGFNTQTYKYFIDFAAANGLEYVNLDEGWSDQFDLLKVTTELDLPEVIRYAKQKNVGLILWCVWHTLDKQLIPAMEQFQKWGIAGLKVDFMDRDDQDVINYYERVAAEAAKRKMLVNFHGASKPTGLERTYPNVINRESVLGLEYNKFSNKCTPEHDVHIPFIRMMAGPMDYTPGAMFNANKNDFRIINDRPMSQGTRCHQLAMFVAYYAPLQMLADAPTAYEQEPDILNFLKAVPTTWDETRPLDGKIGEYLAIARRKGTIWYIGAMTGWTGRSLKTDLSFLGNGTYTLEYFTDGPNAHRIGNDYKKLTRTVTSKDVLDINLASGGGWAARITPVK